MSKIKEKAYDSLYQNMNNGVYNKIFRTWEKNRAPSSEISLILVKKACAEHKINLDEFLTYVKKRKAEESEGKWSKRPNTKYP